MYKLNERQEKRIRDIITGYRIYNLLTERMPDGKPAYGVWYGHNTTGFMRRGDSIRKTVDPLSLNQAREAMAEFVFEDIKDAIERWK